MKIEPPNFNSIIPELQVRDLELTRQFYVEILGFSIKFERSDFLFLELGRSQLMVTTDGYVTGNLEYPLGRGMNLEIEVDSLDPLIVSLETANYPLWRPPHDCVYQCGEFEVSTRQFLIQDPDGYLLRFSTSLGDRLRPE